MIYINIASRTPGTHGIGFADVAQRAIPSSIGNAAFAGAYVDWAPAAANDCQ